MLTEYQVRVLTTFGIANTLLFWLLIMAVFSAIAFKNPMHKIQIEDRSIARCSAENLTSLESYAHTFRSEIQTLARRDRLVPWLAGFIWNRTISSRDFQMMGCHPGGGPPVESLAKSLG